MSAHRKKYRSAIVACARWESPYVAEWIRYHVDLGFDHIYLYCNDEEPDEFQAALASLHPRYRKAVSDRPFHGQGLQRAMYLDALPQATQESDWISFLDIDEFLVLKQWRTIAEMIEHLDARAVSSLHFNWVFYGHNGHPTRPPGDVLANYTRRANHVDVHTKHVSRSSCFERSRVQEAAFPIWHGLGDAQWLGFRRENVLGRDMGPLLQAFPSAMIDYLAAGTASDAMIATAYVAHFVFKSADDFRLRVARGLRGDFAGQIKWLRAIEQGQTEAILSSMNEVEDRYLLDRSMSAEQNFATLASE